MRSSVLVVYHKQSLLTSNAHLLRHSHATELIKAGWDASYVQKRLGHAQVQTTINTYVHLDEEDLSLKWRAYQKEKQDGKDPFAQANTIASAHTDAGETLGGSSGRAPSHSSH